MGNDKFSLLKSVRNSDSSSEETRDPMVQVSGTRRKGTQV